MEISIYKNIIRIVGSNEEIGKINKVKATKHQIVIETIDFKLKIETAEKMNVMLVGSCFL